ncbi:MAG TPA: hypothetical protein VHB79_34915 [Polyangiaceae bacterium]|nr:hypothetical protein [Polyangiaceae bacterium]
MKRARWRARAVLDKSVPVELGEVGRLTYFGRYAAVPARSVIEAGDERRIEVKAPGATARSTEVRWDRTNERLLVGVWCGKPPQRLDLPLKFPLPELAWFASFHLPGYAGEAARVSVEHGLINIRVPPTRSTQPLTAVVDHRGALPTPGDYSGPAPSFLDVQAA